MSYIRIKVKHMMVIVLAVMILLVLTTVLRGYILYGLGKLSDSLGDASRAKVYYDRAVNSDIQGKSAVYAAKSKLDQIIEEKGIVYFDTVHIAGGGKGIDGYRINADSIDKINVQYIQLAANQPKDDVFAEYQIAVALMNYSTGNLEKAIALLEEIDFADSTEVTALQKLYLASIYISQGNMEQGMAILQQPGELPGAYALYASQLKAYCDFLRKDWQAFRQHRVESSEMYKQTLDIENPLIRPFNNLTATLEGYNELLEQEEQKIVTGNCLTGRVLRDGKPAPYVMVYVQKITNMGSFGSHLSSDIGITNIGITDTEGYYRIQHIPDGVYGMGIVMDWTRGRNVNVQMHTQYDLEFEGDTDITSDVQLLSLLQASVSATPLEGNRIRFDFDCPVKASHYGIRIAELRKAEDGTEIVSQTPYISDIQGFPFILDIEKERREGLLSIFASGDRGVNPYDILPPLYHTGEYAYVIYAYNEGDIVYASHDITSGEKYPTVHIQGTEWTATDRLLMDGKYEAAMAGYETEVEDNPDDLHALKILANLYTNGWRYNRSTGELEGADARKAAKYYEMIASRIDNPQAKSFLANAYMRLKQYDRAKAILETLAMQKPEYNHDLARIYGYQDQFALAADAWKRCLDATGYGGANVMMLDILQNRTDRLQEVARKYNQYSSYYGKYDKLMDDYCRIDRSGYEAFFADIRQGKAQDAKNKIHAALGDLARMYEGILMLQTDRVERTERDASYTVLYEQVKDPVVRELMRCFGKEEINSMFGNEG